MHHPLALAAALALAFPPALVQAKDPAPVQFLDRTVITVPRTAGKFKLQHAETFPGDVLSGVSTGWEIEGAPMLALNVYVYPLGEAGEAKMVEQQANEVEAEIKAVAAQGAYTDVEFGPHTPFLVVRRPSTIELESENRHAAFDPNPRDESVKEKIDEADPLAKILAEDRPPPNNHGIREAMSFKRDGMAMRSMAYVFHRHLFGFKVRASIAESDMDQAAFEALADEAARWLVPQIEVQSFGTCGTIRVPVSENKNDDGKAAAEAMVRGLVRTQNDNCATIEGKQKHDASADSQQLELVYPANMWKSR